VRRLAALPRARLQTVQFAKGARQLDSKQRFSNRVDDYVRYRPHYPKEVIDILVAEAGLRPESVIADIGSGTGISSEMFLANGNRVIGVEPNAGMRAAGEKSLGSYPGFQSVDGSAEATTLPDDSVDFVAAGQAFHWFDRAACRREFARILRPGGKVILMWNSRRIESSGFSQAYDQLLARFAKDYPAVRHMGHEDEMAAGFFPGEFAKRTVYNFQEFDFAGLRGRLLSSSYVPAAREPNHEAILAGLREVFDAHAVNGNVRIEYDTEIYFGTLRGDAK
jgi:ubiquinone/menaquinone biosynthesis C-methylase UbiE